MNAQKTDSENSHSYYRKDYSKLEKIFNAAVEKRNQKKIIYYASDRLFSDDSKKQRVKETYKTIAWATPVSTDDIQTEIISLAKHKKLIPISPTILKDESSLISFLEISSDIEEDNLDAQSALDIYQKVKESFEKQQNNVETQVSNNLDQSFEDNQISISDNSSSTKSLMDRYYEMKDSFVRATEQPNLQENNVSYDKLINSQKKNNKVELESSQAESIESLESETKSSENLTGSSEKTDQMVKETKEEKPEEFKQTSRGSSTQDVINDKDEIISETSLNQEDLLNTDINDSSLEVQNEKSESKLKTDLLSNEKVTEEPPKLEDVLSKVDTEDQSLESEIITEPELEVETINKSEIENTPELIEEEKDSLLTSNTDKFKTEATVNEESATLTDTNNLQEKESNLEESKPDVYDLLNQQLGQIDESTDLDIRKMIASIQDDDSYLVKPSKEEIEVNSEDLFSFKDDSDTYLSENNLENSANEEIDVSEKFQTAPLDIIEDETKTTTLDKATESAQANKTQDNFKKENTQLKENENKSITSTRQKTSILFDETSSENQVSYSEQLNKVYKEFLGTRLSLIIAIGLLLLYSILMFPRFQGYDYIALVLCLVGTFLAWDLKRDHLILVGAVALIIIAACMYYRTMETGIFDGPTHLVWFLLIPLLMISSYLYNSYKRQYYLLLNKGKKPRRKPTSKTPDKNKSLFLTDDK